MDGFPADNTRVEQQLPASNTSPHPCMPVHRHAGTHTGGDISQLLYKWWCRGERVNIIRPFCHADADCRVTQMHKRTHVVVHFVGNICPHPQEAASLHR